MLRSGPNIYMSLLLLAVNTPLPLPYFFIHLVIESLGTCCYYPDITNPFLYVVWWYQVVREVWSLINTSLTCPRSSVYNCSGPSVCLAHVKRHVQFHQCHFNLTTISSAFFLISAEGISFFRLIPLSKRGVSSVIYKRSSLLELLSPNQVSLVSLLPHST